MPLHQRPGVDRGGDAAAERPEPEPRNTVPEHTGSASTAVRGARQAAVGSGGGGDSSGGEAGWVGRRSEGPSETAAVTATAAADGGLARPAHGGGRAARMLECGDPRLRIRSLRSGISAVVSAWPLVEGHWLKVRDFMC
jgi:hypothetical protein